jgi:cellulose biosynthesis protein BcsQ
LANTVLKGLDVIPSTLDLSGAEIEWVLNQEENIF